ncbi:MAG: ferredoxin-thioredoxin reductase catalytic domain-containing protein [Methanomicrobiales archaeon]|nr:ferredoxin-thioredoxin reductase catalytic domain-containing protein [Methanomicrobiales archaeon]
MSSVQEPSEEEIRALYERLKTEAEEGGYHLNPDMVFVRDLVRGLLVNQRRYGYPSCPCRIAKGRREDDIDIECPCDYRDADLGEYGACYCALYVSEEVLSGKKSVGPVPERRPPPNLRRKVQVEGAGGRPAGLQDLKYPVWRCRVCGYLCARNEPPETCPVCRAKRDRFERFI